VRVHAAAAVVPSEKGRGGERITARGVPALAIPSFGDTWSSSASLAHPATWHRTAATMAETRTAPNTRHEARKEKHPRSRSLEGRTRSARQVGLLQRLADEIVSPGFNRPFNVAETIQGREDGFITLVPLPRTGDAAH